MALRISAIAEKISVVLVLGMMTLGVESQRPAQAFGLGLQGSSTGSWTLPSNATDSTRLSGTQGGTQNLLDWGLTRSQVPTCATCTDFNNFVEFNGNPLNPELGQAFSLGQLTYRNASTTDLVNGQFQTVDFAMPLQISLLFNQSDAPLTPFNIGFNILNTPNVPDDPLASADILSFETTGSPLQRFQLGGKRYVLNLLGFGTAIGSLSGAFRVVEAMSPMELFTVSLFARIDEEDPIGNSCH
jgi:hypothetical protein